MKAPAVVTVLLALTCATAHTAPAHPVGDDPQTRIAGLAADLTSYWQTTLASRVPAYQGVRAIVYYQDPIETPCGPVTMRNARYCPGDDTIYLDQTWLDELLAVGDDTAVAVLAHEWGHEVQNELGTLERSSEHPYLRALELQADCYAGLFVRSQQDAGRNNPSTVADARRFFFSAGDPSPKTRNHGTGPQRLRWFNAGYRSANLDTCQQVIRKEHAIPRIPDQ